VNAAAFGNLVVIAVDEAEPNAADTLTIGRTTLVSASCPRTEIRLAEAGITAQRVDISELENGSDGISSLCLLLEPRSTRSGAGEVGLRPVQVSGMTEQESGAAH
jgi:hypothetical protein